METIHGRGWEPRSETERVVTKERAAISIDGLRRLGGGSEFVAVYAAGCCSEKGAWGWALCASLCAAHPSRGRTSPRGRARTGG